MMDPARGYSEEEIAEYLKEEHEAFWWSQERQYHKTIGETIADWYDEHPGWSKLIIAVIIGLIFWAGLTVSWVGALCGLALVFGLIGLCVWALVSIIYDAIHDFFW